MPQILVSVLKVWVLWVQGKVRMTTGLPFCSQATAFLSVPSGFLFGVLGRPSMGL